MIKRSEMLRRARDWAVHRQSYPEETYAALVTVGAPEQLAHAFTRDDRDDAAFYASADAVDRWLNTEIARACYEERVRGDYGIEDDDCGYECKSCHVDVDGVCAWCGHREWLDGMEVLR